MACYLVTGAAGFIGSAIARRLIAQGDEVVTIDNLSTGRKENIPKGCRWIRGNTFDSDVLEELKRCRFHAIIHMAGQSSGEISFDDPTYDLQTNTQSTVMLLNYALMSESCRKFIYASSMSVYGEQDPPFVSEDRAAMPKSFYAVGKLASEHYMRIYSGMGLECTALRLFNVYGIGQNMENLRQGMISIYMAMAIKNRNILVKGSKNRYRDFVYIDDVIDAVMAVLKKKDDGEYHCYNVSTGIKTTVENVIKEIERNLPFKPTVEYAKGTPGDQHGIYGDNTRIGRELGWAPQISVQDGIAKMAGWALGTGSCFTVDDGE